MNKYILTTSTHMGSYVTTNCIVAKDEFEALSKAYKYYGGCQLSNEAFEALCRNISIERLYKIFQKFTGENILYFALKPDECFICDLAEIEG